MKKIVLTGDFSHETNTFNEHPPGKAEFEAYYAIFGEQILTRFKILIMNKLDSSTVLTIIT